MILDHPETGREGVDKGWERGGNGVETGGWRAERARGDAESEGRKHRGQRDAGARRAAPRRAGRNARRQMRNISW